MRFFYYPIFLALFISYSFANGVSFGKVICVNSDKKEVALDTVFNQKVEDYRLEVLKKNMGSYKASTAGFEVKYLSQSTGVSGTTLHRELCAVVEIEFTRAN